MSAGAEQDKADSRDRGCRCLCGQVCNFLSPDESPRRPHAPRQPHLTLFASLEKSNRSFFFCFSHKTIVLSCQNAQKEDDILLTFSFVFRAKQSSSHAKMCKKKTLRYIFFFSISAQHVFQNAKWCILY